MYKNQKQKSTLENIEQAGVLVLDDIRAHIESALLKNAIHNVSADEIAVNVFNGMAEHWGGQLIYFPKCITQKISRRNQQIWQDFTGTNYSELAKSYGLSLQRIYQIIGECRKKRAKLTA